MFKVLRQAFSIPDLRKKLLFTVLIVIIFRLGAAVPVPFMNSNTLKASIDAMMGVNGENSNNLVGYINSISGGAFQNATLFAMGVTPYINSSIIMQLLMVAIPALERIGKEGEDGRKKIAAITRYVTVILGLIQGFAYYLFIRASSYEGQRVLTTYGKGTDFFVAVVIILVLTAGTALMMWFGEQINQYGLGNGISMLLFASIVARGPQAFFRLYQMIATGIAGVQAGSSSEIKYLFFAPGIVILFLAIVGFIVFMNSAERRIPVQYAKRVVGRKVYGGQSTHLPIKVNMSGVMPIIFASSILMVPSTLQSFIYGTNVTDEATRNLFWYKALGAVTANQWIYALLTFLLILAFAYFYVTIQYNPVEMANNLRKNSGTVPGIRPGKPTSDYIAKIISRITLIGALCLSVVSVFPSLLSAAFKINIGLSGTSIIILVGVALETVQQLESQMLMRHYKGFLE